jgi:hypothetical protein
MLVYLKLIFNLAYSRNRAHCLQKTLELALQNRTPQRDLPLATAHFNRMRMRDESPHLGPHTRLQNLIVGRRPAELHQRPRRCCQAFGTVGHVALSFAQDCPAIIAERDGAVAHQRSAPSSAVWIKEIHQCCTGR